MITMLAACAFIPMAKSQAVPAETADVPGQVRLILPRAIYAVANVETNIFFDNVVLTSNSKNYTFEVNCQKGMLFEDRWAYTPASEEEGEYPLTLEVRDETNKVVARAHSTLHVAVASAKAGDPVTLLAIGDSLTEASVYTGRLLELASGADGPSLHLIGSRGPNNSPAQGANRHEGYSGWTAEAFVTRTGPLSRSGYFKGEETGSPFVYVEDGKKQLDFGRYCAQFNNHKAPDFVTIALGTNDIARATDDTIDSTTDTIFSYLDQLVDMVHKYNASTKVGVFLVIPPSASQDGFRHYKGSERMTRWQYRRNQHRFVERLIAHYGGRESENTYLIPAYLSLDAAHDFVTRPATWSAENPEEVNRVIDGIHPAPAGYREMASAIYSWVKVCLSH
ncbi:MAG: SGNH/GDSL hydrolase family protein [Acidobacteriaceae bacterium]